MCCILTVVHTNVLPMLLELILRFFGDRFYLIDFIGVFNYGMKINNAGTMPAFLQVKEKPA